MCPNFAGPFASPPDERFQHQEGRKSKQGASSACRCAVPNLAFTPCFIQRDSDTSVIQNSFLFLANPQSQIYFAVPAPLNTVTGPFVASDNNIWALPTQTGCSSSPTGDFGSSTWTNSTCTPSQRDPQTSSPNASRLQAPHPSPLFLITIFKTKKITP